jgi:tetratricopeptide (TPR) repeat protein
MTRSASRERRRGITAGNSSNSHRSFADSGDTIQLDATVAELRKVAPDRHRRRITPPSRPFLHGDVNEALARAQKAIALDPHYAPTYDLAGAAYTKLDQLELARQAFRKSLSFDAHDSTAYENLVWWS